MSLRDDIERKFIEAMKAKNAAVVSTLRMLRAALKNTEIEKQVKSLSDDQVLEVIARETKKMKDSLADFEKGGREDLTSSVKAEIAFLSEFLPQQISEEEVRAAVKSRATALGLSGPAAFGRLMGEAMKDLKGKADGTVVGKIVKEVLGT